MRKHFSRNLHSRLISVTGFPHFCNTYKILFGAHLKHSSFWPSANVKPMSNDLVHVMLWHCKIAPLCVYVYNTISMLFMGKLPQHMTVTKTMEECALNINNCLNTNMYSYWETSGSQSSTLYSNIVHFFNASVN